MDAGSITGTSGAAISITGGDAAFTSDVTVSVATGRAVQVLNRSSSTVTFDGPVTATGGTGISLTGNASVATIAFTDTLSLSTGTSPAFTATGGTVSATGAGSTLTTTTATALNVAGAVIGAADITFRSITAGTPASGPANGIVLANTGSTGGLHVVGTGTNNSGGTIQHTSGPGISLTNTADASFDEIVVDTTAGSGISGTGVIEFTLTDSTITNSGTVGGADTSNIAFNTTSSGTENNLSGAVTITGNTLTNATWHGIDILDYAGTISNATITGNTITSTTDTATSKGSAIRLQASGSASAAASITTGTISTNTIRNFPSGAGIQVFGGKANVAGPVGGVGSIAQPLQITSNDIQGQSAVARMGTSAILVVVDGVGSGAFNVSSNTLAHTSGSTIGVGGSGNTTTTVSITNNLITGNTINASNGIAVGTGDAFAATDTPTLDATISGNTITQTDGNGILAVARFATGP